MDSKRTDLITLFLCGDVMTGRGIDQIMPHPSDPVLHEPYVRDARRYVELTEKISGPIPRDVDPAYIWGDALDELERVAPDLRIINLETSITRSADYWKGKEVLYRMHPENIDCLIRAGIDACSLANNHVLDWGYAGLQETLETLRKAKIRGVGAGMNLREAESPAIMEVKGRGRVIVFAFGSPTSGIPLKWAASAQTPGVHLLRDFSEGTVESVRWKVQDMKREGDLVVASIHWGGNWGYPVPSDQIEFAHGLIDRAGVDLIHGQSSHHVKGIEVYRGRLVLYGSGDFLNDYEGIGGYDEYRGDLSLMYFPELDPATGKLIQLQMVPTRVWHLKVSRASRDDASWLTGVLNREGKKLGTAARLSDGSALELIWE